MFDAALLADWQAVIGLEIHVELNTRSKLFSSAANHFGDEPNTNITDVCTGQPGTLPVLNKEAVRKAVAFGSAISAHIARYSRFDRKSYFYPDSPRNFQITQFEMPIIVGGKIIADVEGKAMSFAVNRAHLEDDAGMLKHFPSFTGVDYNRAGVPLLEIVSEPCIFSAKEAVCYAMAVKAIMEYLDASDCDMEKGSLRIDANISVRKKGEMHLRPKIEIKNMNSFNFLAQALESEFKRQVKEYLTHSGKDFKEVIFPSTYRFDPDRKELVLMRRKETADDYRYFLEPDLPPLILEDEYVDAIAKSLPELPYAKEKRYIEELKCSHDNAYALVSEKKLADYFEEGLKKTSNAKALSNWILVEFAGRLNEKGVKIWESEIKASLIAELINLIDEGKITGKIAKAIADAMVENPGKTALSIIEENPDYVPVFDVKEIERVIDEVLAVNTQSVTDYKSGKIKAFAFLVGQVMKLTQGKAAPALVNQLLKKKLEE